MTDNILYAQYILSNKTMSATSEERH